MVNVVYKFIQKLTYKRKIYKCITFVNMKMNIPLQAKLKRESHRKIAYAQDLIVMEVYAIIERAVMHGGTAIWRCYSGKRFSEDLNFYLPRNIDKLESLFKNLQSKGFLIKKKESRKKAFTLSFN